MIAERLILWHTYDHGVAFDLSENRNHGRLVDVGRGVGPFATAMHFQGGDSAVRVAPSPTLTNLREVRAQVRFYWDPTVPGARRHNLVEGHGSFALFIHPDASLHGTIYNQLDSWEGAVSGPGVVSARTWHTAEFVHDGIAHGTVYLDGQVVAEGYSSPGPVRSVSTYGVAIGHWPDDPDVYTLEGYIDEVRIWCDDPVRTGGGLIDDCCIDPARIEQVPADVAAGGHDPAILANPKPPGAVPVPGSPPPEGELGTMVRAMLDIGRRAASHMASGSAAERDHALDLGRRLLLAYDAKDDADMIGVITDGAAVMSAKTSAADLATMWSELQAVMAPLPGAAAVFAGSTDVGAGSAAVAGEGPPGGEPDRPGIRAWLEPWCLDGLLPHRPPDREHRPRDVPPTVDRSLDPHTDVDRTVGPDGQPAWDGRGSHEAVPEPQPDTPPGGPGPGPIDPDADPADPGGPG